MEQREATPNGAVELSIKTIQPRRVTADRPGLMKAKADTFCAALEEARLARYGGEVTHQPAAEMSVHEGVPRGTVYESIMNSADSKTYPGIARDAQTFGTPDPSDPASLVVTTSHPAPYSRRVTVYVSTRARSSSRR